MYKRGESKDFYYVLCETGCDREITQRYLTLAPLPAPPSKLTEACLSLSFFFFFLSFLLLSFSLPADVSAILSVFICPKVSDWNWFRSFLTYIRREAYNIMILNTMQPCPKFNTELTNWSRNDS